MKKITNEEMAAILRSQKSTKEGIKLFCEFLANQDAEPSDFISILISKCAKKALKWGFNHLSTDEQCLLYVSYMGTMNVERGVIDAMAYFFGITE